MTGRARLPASKRSWRSASRPGNGSGHTEAAKSVAVPPNKNADIRSFVRSPRLASACGSCTRVATRSAEVATLPAGGARLLEARDRRKTRRRNGRRAGGRLGGCPAERLFHQCEFAVEPAPQSGEHSAQEPMLRVSNDQPFAIRGLHERPASRAFIQVRVENHRRRKPAASIRSNDQQSSTPRDRLSLYAS